MNRKVVVAHLIKCANELDKNKLYEEANILTKIAKQIVMETPYKHSKDDRYDNYDPWNPDSKFDPYKPDTYYDNAPEDEKFGTLCREKDLKDFLNALYSHYTQGSWVHQEWLADYFLPFIPKDIAIQFKQSSNPKDAIKIITDYFNTNQSALRKMLNDNSSQHNLIIALDLQELRRNVLEHYDRYKSTLNNLKPSEYDPNEDDPNEGLQYEPEFPGYLEFDNNDEPERPSW